MTHIIRVIDLETTGFTPPEHAPCEVAWWDLVTDRADLADSPSAWEVYAGLSVLCYPGRDIPPESSAIHHLIDGDVASKIDWRKALYAGVTDALSINVFAAHNAKFERQWLTDDLTGGKPWICTYKCALRLWPEAPGHSNQTLRYWRKPEGLDRSIANVAHRAGPDAYVTAFLLRDMLELASLDQLIAWTNEPALLARIPFGALKGQPWSEADDGLLDWMLRKTFSTPDFTEDIHFTARAELEKRDASHDDFDQGAFDAIA